MLVFKHCNPIFSLLTFFFFHKVWCGNPTFTQHNLAFHFSIWRNPRTKVFLNPIPPLQSRIGVTLDIFTVNIVQQQSNICLLVQSHIFRQDIGVALYWEVNVSCLISTDLHSLTYMSLICAWCLFPIPSSLCYSNLSLGCFLHHLIQRGWTVDSLYFWSTCHKA